MHPNLHFASIRSVLPLLALTGLTGLTAITPPANAARYLVTVESTFLRDDSSTETFDGVNFGTLPFFPLDNARLIGGTMRERFIISDVVAETSGGIAFYDFQPSADWTYDLFDPQGALVHHGSGSSQGGAIVQNNNGAAPFIVDQVLISSSFASVTNLTPTSSDFTLLDNLADLSAFGYVSPGVEYLSDLSVPLDASVYLSFPAGQVITNAIVTVGSGDVVNFTAPYAFSNSSLQYSVTSLSIVAIPEPASLWVAALGTPLLARRRR